MASEIYAVAIRHDAGDYVVSVRDLPEVVTSGDSLAEALALAADAIAVVLAARFEAGEPPPAPAPRRDGEHEVRVTVGRR